MKMKKILGVLLASVMLIGMLAGCGPKEQELSGVAAQYVDTDEKLTLSWLGFPGWEAAKEGTASELVLEEAFNVDIKPLFYEYGKFNDQKLNLFASGETPDLIYHMDPANLFVDVDQGFIAELPYETLKMYAPNLTNYITENMSTAWLYTRYDGANWGLPNWANYHMAGGNSVWRKDWLDKFGLEVPETIDEMHDAFVKFAKEDPDGNGKDDTYGITVMNGAYHGYFSEIFGAYGVLPFEWQEVDGEIVYGGTREETKEALKTLAAWYKEGLIHPDFITGGNSADNYFTSGAVGYRYFNMGKAYEDGSAPTSTEYRLKANVPGAEIAYGFLPKGPNGDHGHFAWSMACNGIGFGNGEGYEKKVPRMLKMFEGLFNDVELWEKVALGEEGVTWERDPGSKGIVGYKFIGEAADTVAQRELGLAPNGYGYPAFFTAFGTDYDTYYENLSDSYKEWYSVYGDPSSDIASAFFKSDIVPSASNYLTPIRDQQLKLIAQIIVGEKSVDDYDSFIEFFYNNGGQTMLDETKDVKADLNALLEELK